MTEQVESENKNKRKRIPLGVRNILTAPNKPGFVRRFVNDEPDRIQSFKDAGYNVVDDPNITVGDPKIGQASSLGNVTNPHIGQGKRAVLMEIPKEFYNEDQADRQAKITKVENEMRRKPGQHYADGLSGSVSIS